MSYYSGKKAAGFLGVVPDEEKLISKLRKQCFNPLSCLYKRDESGLSVLLVEPVGAFKSDVVRLEKVKLDFRANVLLVSEDTAIAVNRLNILQIVDVVYTRLGKVNRTFLGRHNSQNSAHKSEKRGTGPRRRTFPPSVTKSSENYLPISKNLTNFVYRLHITRL